MGHRDEKSKKELLKPTLQPKPVYQGTAFFQMLYIFSVHIKTLSLNPEDSKASPKKSHVIKSAQYRKSGSVHRCCLANSEGSV